MLRKAIVICFLFLASPVFAADVKFVENPVPATSFAEATIVLAPQESVVWMVTPEPTKMVETGNMLYFNGPAGEYSVTALVQSIEGMKVKTVKVKAKVTLGTTPPVPVPTNAYQEAFDQETAPERYVYAGKLAALYTAAAKLDDPNVKTYGQLYDKMEDASRKLLPATAIPKVRAVIGKQLNPLFGAASSLIDKDKVAKEFKSVADSLNSLK